MDQHLQRAAVIWRGRSVVIAGVGDLNDKSGELIDVPLSFRPALQFLGNLLALIRRGVKEATQRG